MKKLLKIVFALAGVASTPLSVIACSQNQTLDSFLSNIYAANKGSFNIKEWGGKVANQGTYDSKNLLTIDKLQPSTSLNLSMDNIANGIAKTANKDSQVNLFDANTAVGTKCYNYIINNGKTGSDSTGVNYTFGANNEISVASGMLQLKISFEIGTVSSNKTFLPTQRINMAYKIKIQNTESDTLVNQWVSSFNSDLKKVANTTINVNPDPKNSAFPSDNSTWLDLTKAQISAAYSSLETKEYFSDLSFNSLSFLFNCDKSNKFLQNKINKVWLNVSLDNSDVVATDYFSIQFISPTYISFN